MIAGTLSDRTLPRQGLTTEGGGGSVLGYLASRVVLARGEITTSRAEINAQGLHPRAFGFVVNAGGLPDDELATRRKTRPIDSIEIDAAA